MMKRDLKVKQFEMLEVMVRVTGIGMLLKGKDDPKSSQAYDLYSKNLHAKELAIPLDSKDRGNRGMGFVLDYSAT